MMKTRGIQSVGFIAVLLVLLVQCKHSKENIHPLTNSWEIAVPNQEVPLGLSSLSAQHCGSCHQQHYEEWKLSTHAHAWTDLQFQAELQKDSSPFMCINCHIPLQNQQEHLVEGLVDGDIYRPIKKVNPKFDPDLQQEGINCASCHVRNNTIIGPYGTTSVPHQSVKDTAFLSENLCISCHNATAVITPTLACTFETGDEWRSGPYFGEKNCISCHMEAVEREIAMGFGKRPSRFHYFPGSGIPKLDSVPTKGLNGLAIHTSDMAPNYSQKDSMVFTLKVVNEHAGHKVPTGDPERFFNITFILTDTKDSILSTKTERIGEQWEWYPEAKKLGDNNLAPKEERLYRFVYQPKAKGQLKLSAKISKHRLDRDSADYNKLNEHYPLSIVIFEEDHTLLIN